MQRSERNARSANAIPIFLTVSILDSNHGYELDKPRIGRGPIGPSVSSAAPVLG